MQSMLSNENSQVLHHCRKLKQMTFCILSNELLTIIQNCYEHVLRLYGRKTVAEFTRQTLKTGKQSTILHEKDEKKYHKDISHTIFSSISQNCWMANLFTAFSSLSPPRSHYIPVANVHANSKLHYDIFNVQILYLL